MPLNLLKVYNSLLELAALSELQRANSLRGVFRRDIEENSNFKFRTKQIKPTTADGEDSMDRLFRHLTTCITDKATKHREFEMSRSLRLHWIRHHVEERKKDNMYIFSVDEPRNGIRTYIYDRDENYVIVFEPLRNENEYYLLTAYYLEGKDAARDKMMRKYKRRLPDIL